MESVNKSERIRPGDQGVRGRHSAILTQERTVNDGVRVNFVER
jgi:hypothetical protein